MEKKASTETGHGHRKDEPVHRLGVCCLCGSSLTRMQGWVTSGDDTLGHRHTQTEQFLAPSHCSVLLMSGGGGPPPTADRLPAGGVHAVLLRTEACGGLLIPVNQRHYGDLKIFLVSLQIIIIVAALF